MLALDEHNAPDYLRRAGRIDSGERLTVSVLAGGVSNQVLYVSRPDRPGADFVLKQVRAQLRTPEPWFASIERIWREVEVLRVCQRVLESAPAGTRPDHGGQAAADATLEVTTPRVVFEDREEYIFAMTAAPREHRVWKAELLAGRTSAQIARACGRLLALLHSATWLDDQVARSLGDQKLFDELRIDPYYRSVMRASPPDRPHLERLIGSLAEHPRCLVHADFSPKNLLVYPGGLMMVDFETGHFGDPAFDLGFFLSHLVLKSVHAAPEHGPYLHLVEQFWDAYREGMHGVAERDYQALVERASRNFAACAWARLDGTSKIDYLHDPLRRDRVRQLAREILGQDVVCWDEVIDRVERVCEACR